MDINSFEELVMARASHRKFLSDAVPNEDIEKMVNCARLAPSGHNLQPWRFIAVKNKDVITKMAEALEENLSSILPNLNEEDAKKLEDYKFFIKHFQDAPVSIAVFAREKNYISSNLESKYNLELLRPELFNMTLLGVGGAVNNLLLAAEAMGYGSCWMTEPVIYGQKAIEALLGVEEPFKFVTLVAIGKPVKKRAGAPKKSVEEVLTVIE